MSYEDFYPYQKMMLYILLLTLRGRLQGKKKDKKWAESEAMIHWIDTMGLDIDPMDMLNLSKKKINKCLWNLRGYDRVSNG